MVSDAQLEIDVYLKKIEEKLPGWLKECSKDKMDVLTELEEHIWDKAEELAQGEDPSLRDVQKAIIEMGSPYQIAKEFKKRGTPKVYITEEWWDWYLKVLKIVLLVMTGISLISIVFQFGKIGIWEIFGDLISNLWSGLLFGFLIVSIIFTLLSMNGYLPQDFKDAIDSDKDITLMGIEIHPKKNFSKSTEYESNWRQKYANTYDRAMGIKKETYNPQYQTVPQVKSVEYEKESEMDFKSKEKAREKRLEKSKVKPPLKRSSLLSDGIWGIIWNIFFIIQPFDSLNQYFTLEFLEFVKICAAVGLVVAIIKLMRVFVGMYRITTQQLLIIILIAANILLIPIYLDFMDNPDAYVIFSNVVGFDWRPSERLITIVMWIAIIGTGIESLEMLNQVSSYPRKLRSYQSFLAGPHGKY